MKKYVPMISARKCNAALIIFIIIQFINVAHAQNTRDQDIIKQMESYTVLLNPSAKQKVIQSAGSLGNKIITADKNADLHTIAVSGIRNQYKGMSDQDIDALVVLVMFDIWKSEEEDLKELIDEIDKVNEAKQMQREVLDNLNKQKASAEEKIREEYRSNARVSIRQIKVATPTVIKETARTRRLGIKYTRAPQFPLLKDPKQMLLPELDSAIKNTAANLKTLEDIGQLDQVALQDAMQKQAQILQLISNISKMMHDTLKGIIQNLR